MGRPDLSHIRRDEILDAFERCVAQSGLEGASLDAIAQEAGMKRQAIRHYIGNREDVLRAFGRRLIARLHQDIDLMVRSLPGDNRVRSLIEMLFMGCSPGAGDTPASILLLGAMIASAEREPEYKDLVNGYIESLVSVIESELCSAYPKHPRVELWDIANGLVGLSFHNESLRPLKLGDRFERSAKACAHRLVECLSCDD